MKYKPLYLIVFLLINFSCGNREKKASETDKTIREEPGMLYRQEFLKRLEALNPGLRDPAGFVELLEYTGAEFIPELVNDTGYVAAYLKDSALSAMNMGIYTVDLVYLLAYEQQEKADAWLDKSRLLADNIGAGHLYDHAMYKRYRTAGVPSDTLIKLLSKASESIEHEYGKMELLRLYTLFATGEFIEKLHLAISMLIHADSEDLDSYWTLMILFFQQEKALDNLILLLDQIRAEEEGERFMAQMNDLKLIFLELSAREEMAGINTRNLTENQTFRDLARHLDRIRNMVINPE